MSTYLLFCYIFVFSFGYKKEEKEKAKAMKASKEVYEQSDKVIITIAVVLILGRC